MSDERERCLELLGLKPGASAQEIKAAYRDMAKVWHPDRFSHDPRLQEKAQNKLKEINEAYEALTSSGYQGSARASRASQQRAAPTPAPPPVPSNGGKNLWTTMLLICLVVAAGFLAAPLIFRKGESDAGQASASARPAVEVETDEGEATLNRREGKGVEKQKAQAAANATVRASTVDGSIESKAAPPRAIPTATVTIDPTTGRLATAACPIKSLMTYVSGQEPRQYCSADHRSVAQTEQQQPEAKKQSRLKSVLNRAAAPARWLHEKTKEGDGQDD